MMMSSSLHKSYNEKIPEILLITHSNTIEPTRKHAIRKTLMVPSILEKAQDSATDGGLDIGKGSRQTILNKRIR